MVTVKACTVTVFLQLALLEKDITMDKALFKGKLQAGQSYTTVILEA